MFLKAYTFLDNKIGVYSAPFFVPHEGLALRYAHDLGHDANTSIGKHPSDFNLIQVGEYDDNTGQIAAVAHRNLGAVSALIAKEPK